MPDSFGWIEEVDPVTLERIDVSPDLETGGHSFCAGSVLLKDGHFLGCFGRYVHKLNMDLEPVAAVKLDAVGPANAWSQIAPERGLEISRIGVPST